MGKKAPKLVEIMAEMVNELAEYAESMTPVPHHRPSNARWWLAGIIREQPSLMQSEAFLDMLTITGRKWVGLLSQ